MYLIKQVTSRVELKPGFHMIVLIVPIATVVVSKYFETIWRTATIASFDMIVSIASNARDAGSSAMSLGETIAPIREANIFLLFFFDLSAIQPEFILDYWNKSGDFWDSL